MLEKLTNLPTGVVGVEAKGEITREDYENVLLPIIKAAQKAKKKLKFLYYFGPEFKSFSAGAAWEDIKLGFANLNQFESCAVVADNSFIRGGVSLMSPLVPYPVRLYHEGELEKAAVWLGSTEHGKHVEAELLGNEGVVVAEVSGPLAQEDFAVLANTVDPWIKSHRKLNGIVIHAKRFPGWENLGSFLSHVSFVEDHHKKVKRVALSADGKLPEVIPALAKHFIKAKIRHFPYAQKDAATAWAAGAS